jgi:hypothetical protein
MAPLLQIDGLDRFQAVAKKHTHIPYGDVGK